MPGGAVPGGTSPPGAGVKPGGSSAPAAGAALTGPCGQTDRGAGEPKTPVLPGAIGFVEGTGASQPWLSATSSVHGSGSGSAFEQRSIR